MNIKLEKIKPPVVGFIGMGFRLDLILVKLTNSWVYATLKLKCRRRALCFCDVAKVMIIYKII